MDSAEPSPARISDTPASSSSLGGDISRRFLRRLACEGPPVLLELNTACSPAIGGFGVTNWSAWVGTGAGTADG